MIYHKIPVIVKHFCSHEKHSWVSRFGFNIKFWNFHKNR